MKSRKPRFKVIAVRRGYGPESPRNTTLDAIREAEDSEELDDEVRAEYASFLLLEEQSGDLE